MKKLLPPLVLFVSVLAAFAQTAELTNDSVIEMVRAGIAESVIVTKIKNSPTKFDTSVSGLATLTAAKVPEPVINLMIAGTPAQKAPESLEAALSISGKPVRAPSPFYTPFNQLDKNAQKERLKSPVAVQIAAPASTVQQVLIRGFQANGYQIENQSTSSLMFVKPITGFGETLAAGLAMGGNKPRYKMQVSTSEIGGITTLIVNGWVTSENAFGKTNEMSLDKNKKTRAPLEDLLAEVKRQAEVAQ
jgi:hypothetical protein